MIGRFCNSFPVVRTLSVFLTSFCSCFASTFGCRFWSSVVLLYGVCKAFVRVLDDFAVRPSGISVWGITCFAGCFYH